MDTNTTPTDSHPEEVMLVVVLQMSGASIIALAGRVQERAAIRGSWEGSVSKSLLCDIRDELKKIDDAVCALEVAKE